MDFHGKKKNIEILLKNYYSRDLPKEICSNVFDIEKVIKLFEEINVGKYSNIFKIDEDTKIIKKINRPQRMTPSYIFNDGVEPIQYFDYKNNKRYRELSIPHFNYFIAFVYNSILVMDSLFVNIYKNEEDEFSNSPILIVNDGKEIIFNTNDYGEIEFIEEMLVDEPNFLGELEKDQLFNHNVLKDILAEGVNLYYLESDIENYFQNIYTHSLNELKTLSPIKEILSKEIELYLDFIDYYNMKINFNHTKGILTGPISSTISAELLLIAIDKIIKNNLTDEIKYKRFVDDMWFYSNDVSSLDKLKNILQEILRGFNLDIQHEKTHIEKNIRKRKTGNISKVLNDFSFLKVQKNSENYVLEISDLLYINSLLSEINPNNDYGYWKTFLTMLTQKIESKKNIVSSSIMETFLLTMLKIGFLHTPLQTRIYKLIYELIKIDNNGKNNSEIILKVLIESCIYINSDFRDTVGQVWHYHLLLKISDETIKEEEFFKLLEFSENIDKDINPLVLVSFIEKDNQTLNEKIYSYVLRRYKIKENYSEEKNAIENIPQNISYSKWWSVLVQLKSVGNFVESDFNKLFFSRRGKAQKELLYIPFHTIKEPVSTMHKKSEKTNKIDEIISLDDDDDLPF